MRPVDPEPEPTSDPELRRVLEDWAAPALPDSLDRRVRASFRELTPRRPLWQRFFTASVRIPLPVAVAALLLLSLVFWSQRRQAPPPEAAESAVPTQAARLDSKAVVTRTRLSGFEPVRDMNITVIPPNVGP
jgi:hypothetical protein